MTTRSTNGLPWSEERLRVSPPYYRVPADQTRGDPFETPSKEAFSNVSIINLSTKSLYAVQLHPVLMGSVVHLYLTVAFKDTWAPEEETVQWGMLPMPTQESIDDFQAVGGGFSWDQQQIVERIYSQAPFHILGEPIQQQAPGTWLRLEHELVVRQWMIEGYDLMIRGNGLAMYMRIYCGSKVLPWILKGFGLWLVELDGYLRNYVSRTML
ncbi:hypothetical protein TREMEDRAFT_61336 [Tremella mesenterica DSM 1558]|uniref:uncharacterized protein n=1 Tax=Tremella mesenterica (strain ATCC 24925 / CBS 8224 / DSM 1558 / NBRC 9311 / NRRL Y-6157 / RJB 2259-6 / UBC 559-6) TaxID=578456 RepID=UPI0003F49B01|nr:uncharacterized protein TREMEDRAFT_61336 [Tremella mesenterica DSM 1558]EIW70830.1 hypothetical protein TREMEDRAFT_61336 [Tremella mesenterica DSM 1558]